MESDVFLSESLKTSYFLLQCILSQLLQDLNEANLDLIVPILYYFISYPNICKFMRSKFVRFQDLLNKIYGKLRSFEKKRAVLKTEKGNNKEGATNGKESELKRRYIADKTEEGGERNRDSVEKKLDPNGDGGSNRVEKRDIADEGGAESQEKKGNLEEEAKMEDLFEKGENPLECVSSYVLNVDRNLLGFLPLNKFFKENKKAFFICSLQDQFDLKVRLIDYLMEKIGCREEEEKKETVDVTNLMPDLKEVFDYFSYCNT